MTRRRLLLILAAVAAALGGVWWRRRKGLEGAAAKLVATVAPRDSAVAVGKAALPVLAAGTSVEHLVLDIARALEIEPAALEEMANDDLRARLYERVRAEHRVGDTLSIQGWELAVTEARLYTLAAVA